ncbi:MAG: V-type ATPase subunit [Ruminococcus sp.]|nr:V-type ATPase subunit [Ruminococcus sp.]
MRIDDHNATVAKLRAMYGKRMKVSDYNELAAQRRISDIAEMLRNKQNYSETLSGINSNTIHRGMLEDLLRRSIYDNYLKITSFEHIAGEVFFDYRQIQAEVREILNAVHYINAKSEQHIEKMPMYLDKLTRFSQIELAKARTREDLLKALVKTPYDDIIAKIPLRKSGKLDYNPIEKALRSYLYEHILSSDYFQTEESKPLYNLITIDIELINIINAYRMTEYFEYTPEKIRANMLPFPGKLNSAIRNDLMNAPDGKEFIARFSHSYYGRVMTARGIEINGDLEIEAQKLRYQYARHALHTSTSPMLSVYAYMFLFETEVNNITTIIEGIRYGLSEKELFDMIII